MKNHIGDSYKTGDGAIELRCGRWQTVLDDVKTCDAVICDPPFSERTHVGALSTTGESGVEQYSSLSPLEIEYFAGRWCARCSGWIVIHTDDVGGPVFLREMALSDRYVFPLVPVLQCMPRVCGDGPASHGHYLAVSRPRHEPFSTWGSLPGWYSAPREKTWLRGAKSLGLMRAIVRDYSKPGGLIVDPCVGTGTTLLAAAIEGRRAIGAECDPETYSKAVKRIQAGYTRTFI